MSACSEDCEPAGCSSAVENLAEVFARARAAGSDIGGGIVTEGLAGGDVFLEFLRGANKSLVCLFTSSSRLCTQKF